MAKVKYLHIKYYNDYLKSLKAKKATFQLSKTSYSKKIKMKGSIVMFNEQGDSDYETLPLINLVRDNAKDYLSTTSTQQREESYIHFSELINKPKHGEIIYKIDVRSAYWVSALKKGVIQETTDIKLKELFEYKSPEQMKTARLKALGSLATRKIIQEYEKGKMVHEEMIRENTKDIYMSICKDVDNLMRECVNEIGSVVFYYWDCIFAPHGVQKEVLEFFKKREYDVSVGVTKLEFVKIAGTHWVISQSDDKAYLVKKESRALIENIHHEL